MTDVYELLYRLALRLREQSSRGRYAPSPTGPLHLGNARTALLAWLQTRLAEGCFVLRMEDLDRPRVRKGSAAQILDDLDWLGLDWDEGPGVGGEAGPYEQSARHGLYAFALARLREIETVFRCVCSRKDVNNAASAPHGPDGPIYPGTCRFRGAARKTANGRAAWRYRVDRQTVSVDDVLVGSIEQDLGRDVGDFVVQRADGLFAYHLAVVVDDALMGITDVVRGADLLHSTPRQLALFEALGLPAPRYWHVPLMTDSRGDRLSKRDGSDSVSLFRERGGTAAELVGELAASVGLSPRGQALSARELLQTHDSGSFMQALSKNTETVAQEPF